VIRMRIDGQPYRLGVGLVDGKGMLSIPVFTVKRPGTYTIVLINAKSGTKRFVKAEVEPRRR
jgi:hypothetical protein